MKQGLENISLMRSGVNSMFDSKHYVPILKWKRAEQGALKSLEEKYKKYITPLIQLVMPKYKPQEKLEDIVARFEKQAPKIPEKIIEAWGHTPIFIDVSLLFTTPLKVKIFNTILKDGNKLGSIFIPVVHLNDDQKIKNAACSLAKENKVGLCLRIIGPNFANLTELNPAIAEFILASGLDEKDIDLLVDTKETEENSDKYIKYLNLSQSINNLLKWRTFILASGSFPKDLSGCKVDEDNILPRVDWNSWREQTENIKLQRKPSFADYTIQYPIYKEDSQFFHPTCSIKYTLEKNWLIMKGERQKFEQYLASAAELKKDKKFYGESFSGGDKYIAEKAKHFEAYIKNPKIKGTGSTETWLKAGINHHLTLVAHQIANLPLK